jgi:hypothetical protein
LIADFGLKKGSGEWGVGNGVKEVIPDSPFPTPLLQSAIENFITNYRMRTTASSENLNKRTLVLSLLLRHAAGVKVAVDSKIASVMKGQRMCVA